MRTIHTQSKPNPAKQVRKLWSDFERWLVSARASVDRRYDEVAREEDAKWKTTPVLSRIKKNEHEAQKTLLRRALQEEHCQKAREEWQTRLRKANLIDTDWGEMTPEETEAVEKALGSEFLDEPEEVPTENVAKSKTQSFLNVPGTTSAPALSASARAINVSSQSTASSYTCVDPADFTSDDELYEAVPSFPELSVDGDMSIPPPVSFRHPYAMEVSAKSAWTSNIVTSGSNSYSSSSEHLAQSFSSASDYSMYGTSQFTATVPVPAPPKRPPDTDQRASSKTRKPSPTYIGPHLAGDDSNDEEADFELFKMQTRVTKILEFHWEAAKADIDVAINIYQRRLEKAGPADDRTIIAEHEKQMLRLQVEKEEERKNIIAAERKKRRAEIRQRGALQDEARPNDVALQQQDDEDIEKWDRLFNNPPFRVELDENSTFVRRTITPSAKPKSNPAPSDKTQNQIWEANASPTDPVRTPKPSDIARGRRLSQSQDAAPSPAFGASLRPSGWRLKSSNLSQVTSVHESVEERDASDEQRPLESQDVQVPGGFPVEGKSSLVPTASAWGRTAAPKSSPEPAAEPASGPTPASGSPLTRKLNKKQRQAAKKAGVGKAEIDTSSSATIKDAATPEADTPSPSTPRVSVPATKTNNPFNAMFSKDDDLSSTPRLSTMKPSVRFAETTTGADSSLEDKSPWTRTIRKAAKVPEPKAALTPSSKPAAAQAAAEESPWEMMMRKKGQEANALKQHQHQHQPVNQSRAFQDDTWGRTIRVKQPPQPVDPQTYKVDVAPSSVPANQEIPWSRMTRFGAPSSSQPPLKAAPAPAMTKAVHAEEEESPWNMAMKAKMQAAEKSAKQNGAAAMRGQQQQPGKTSGVLPSTSASQNPAEEELKAKLLKFQEEQMRASLASGFQAALTSSSKAAHHSNHSLHDVWVPPHSELRAAADSTQSTADGHSRWSAREHAPQHIPQSIGGHQVWNPYTRTQSPPVEKSVTMPILGAHPSDGQRVRRMSDPVSPSPRIGFTDLPDVGSYRNESSLTSILKKQAAMAARPTASKHVMIEDILDDEDGQKVERLPSDSKHILDIVEPKPSKPRTMFTNIFQYGEDETETESSSMVPTPSTEPVSHPAGVPSLDEEWFLAETKGMMDETSRWGASRDEPFAEPHSQTKHATWMPHGRGEDDLVGNLSLDAFDSNKLLSALESYNNSSFVVPEQVALGSTASAPTQAKTQAQAKTQPAPPPVPAKPTDPALPATKTTTSAAAPAKVAPVPPTKNGNAQNAKSKKKRR